MEDNLDEAAFVSPAWHGEALKETEQRMAAGLEKMIDWDKAKEMLRKEFKKREKPSP